MTETNLMKNKELRKQMAARVDVLDKVKKLFLLPQLEMMTAQQVADYYEVDLDAIQKCYQRNRQEIEPDGVQKLCFNALAQRIGQNVQTVKTRYYTDFKLSDDTTLRVPNGGIRLFSKRAILRIGMLLRDSKIAKEVRTQLLNVFDKTNDSQRIEDIETEQDAMSAMGLAFAAGDIMAFCEATMKYTAFKQRHINELTAKAEKDRPKVEFAETVGSCKNTISIGAYAKILYDRYGINMGRNTLFKWMRDNSILDAKNLPYQKYMNAGWFKVIEVPKSNLNKIIFVVRITPKGQQKLYELVKKNYSAGGITA